MKCQALFSLKKQNKTKQNKMSSAAVMISAVRVRFPAKLYELTNIPDEF